jgi:hypothetical protein
MHSTILQKQKTKVELYHLIVEFISDLQEPVSQSKLLLYLAYTAKGKYFRW